jgi:hypothetical protein
MNRCARMYSDNEDVKAVIVDLEKQALELWNNGYPEGFWSCVRMISFI